MTEEKKDTNKDETKVDGELRKEEPQEEKKVYRQIIIETDGNEMRLIKSEVAGKIELIAILDNLSTHLKNSQNNK